jgi:hypothetical protein
MGWLTLVITTLGAGAAGAVITTYGAQSRDRRAARAEVRAQLLRAEKAARNPDAPIDELYAAIGNLNRAAFVAATPRRIIELYAHATVTARLVSLAVQRRGPDAGHYDIASAAAYAAGDLLVNVLWHPWLMLPVRGLRARHIRQFLDTAMTERDRRAFQAPPAGTWRSRRRVISEAKRWRRRMSRNRAPASAGQAVTPEPDRPRTDATDSTQHHPQ